MMVYVYCGVPRSVVVILYLVCRTEARVLVLMHCSVCIEGDKGMARDDDTHTLVIEAGMRVSTDQGV